ncbi:MAG: hypothetical protein K0Q90_259 [Paenibacillaceae bacterium]|jgi:hypothetical protein|nr:hypothetical protein [Paenibacillaceae bacterium]
MEPNIYQMEKWMAEEEGRLRDNCRWLLTCKASSSAKRPALGPVLIWFGLKRRTKA